MSQPETETEEREPLTPEMITAMAEEETRIQREDPQTAAALARAKAKETAAQQEPEQPARALPTPIPVTLGRQPKSEGKNGAARASAGRSPRSRPTASGEDGGRPRPENLRQGLDQLAQSAQGGLRRAKAPREDDWAEFLAILFGLLSMLFIWWLTNDVPISKQERIELELDDDEADGLSRPAARVIARSFLNDRYGQHLMGGIDLLVMVVVLTAYAERVTPAIKRKLNRPNKRVEARKEEVRQRERDERVVAETAREREPERTYHVYPANFT